MKKYITFIICSLFILNLSNLIFAEDKLELIPSGKVVIIKTDCKYPYVSKFIDKNEEKFELGDIIISINENNLGNENNIKTIENYLKQKDIDLIIKIIREGREQVIKISSDEFRKYKYDYSLSGIGTLTAITENGDFYGLSHNIHLNGTEVNIINSEIYETSFVQEKKSRKKDVGYLISDTKGNKIGMIQKNNEFGVKGKIKEDILKNEKSLEIEKPQVGNAYILCCSPVSNEIKMHKIKILEVGEEISKIQVIDKNLIKFRGGLVQGMSGSPIIQNNKIVGGLRSIYVTNPKEGEIANINSIINNFE